MYDERIARLYFPVLKILNRQWPSRVSPAEFLCLIFILERTYRFGKEEELVTYRQMRNGIHSKEGQTIHGGLKLGRTAIITAITKLREKGLIRYSAASRGKWNGAVMSLNIDAVTEFAQAQDLGPVTKRRVRTRRSKRE